MAGLSGSVRNKNQSNKKIVKRQKIENENQIAVSVFMNNFIVRLCLPAYPSVCLVSARVSMFRFSFCRFQNIVRTRMRPLIPIKLLPWHHYLDCNNKSVGRKICITEVEDKTHPMNEHKMRMAKKSSNGITIWKCKKISFSMYWI